MGRRGAGEGSIYLHKASQRFCTELRLGVGPDGKAQRWRAYADTRREAAALLRKALDERDRGQDLGAPKQTVGAYLDSWLDTVVKPSRRPHTLRGYEVNVRVHITPGLGAQRLDKLTPQHVQKWINDLLESGASPRTAEYACATLHVALQQALRWGLVSRNAASLVNKPSGRAEERPALTPEQARAILAAVEPHRLGRLFAVTVGLGLRQGEALGLRWEDVDLDVRFAQVTVELQRHEKRWQLTALKSRSSARRIPLPPFVVQALREQRAAQAAERLKLGEAWPGWNLVFLTARGTPLDGPNVTHQLQRILATNSLPVLRFHDLRHCTATLLASLGVPQRTIMEILGHSQISTTAEVYTHVTDPMAREAMDRLGEALGGEGGCSQ